MQKYLLPACIGWRMAAMFILLQMFVVPVYISTKIYKAIKSTLRPV